MNSRYFLSRKTNDMPFNVKFVTKVEGQISSKEWLLTLKENLSSDSKKNTSK